MLLNIILPLADKKSSVPSESDWIAIAGGVQPYLPALAVTAAHSCSPAKHCEAVDERMYAGLEGLGLESEVERD